MTGSRVVPGEGEGRVKSLRLYTPEPSLLPSFRARKISEKVGTGLRQGKDIGRGLRERPKLVCPLYVTNPSCRERFDAEAGAE